MPCARLSPLELWTHHLIKVMLGKRYKKSRHKMSMAKLCSCVVAEPEEFPESCRPYAVSSRDNLDQAEQAQNVDSAGSPPVAMATQKGPLEATSEEPEPAQDIEIPPPMEIQDHSFKTSQESPPEEVSAKFASTLSLKAQPEATSAMDLANELENLVKQRMEPSGDLPARSDSGGEEDEERSEQDAEADKEKYIKKRQYVLQELVDTERDYVKDLGCVVEGYMILLKEMDLPEDMEGKDKIVFGNIHQIYDWHKETFEAEIETVVDEPERLGGIFVRYERRLYMYVKYCENKPKSEYIVAEYQDTIFEEIRQKLGHKLTLPDLLIKPVQRIMKYQLILKDILKYTDRAGLDTTDLKKALRVMCVVPKAANDMMQVGRLQGFNGKITAQGKLLLQDTVLVAEVTAGCPQKFKERRVFLFEQIIIFSEMTEKKKGDFSNANYVFKNSVKVNKMSMVETVSEDPLKFILIDRTPGSDMKFHILAPSEEVKQTWIREIKSILDMQGNFLRALQSPIAYQKELTKELSAPEFGSLPRESQLRKTQSHPIAKGGNSVEKGKSKHRHDAKKHERCKSVPAPVQESLAERAEDSDKGQCPNSPSEPSKEFPNSEKQKLGDSAKKSNSSGGEGTGVSVGSGSPKPKKTIFEGFRNTLRKSKNESPNAGGAAASGSKSPESYANAYVMPDVVQDSSLRTSSASGVATPEGSGSVEQHPVEGGITQGRILCDYIAVKEDEISVFRSEVVQILATNPHNMFFVHRPANNNSPAAEGWIPGHILGPKDMDGSLKKHSWQMFKLKKPSFRPEKSIDGTSSLERKSKSLGRDGKPRVRVMSPDFAYEVPPIVQQPLTSVTVEAGETAVLTCKICGRPRPNVTWRFDDVTTIVPSPRVMLLYNEEGIATLQISHVTVSDSGDYSCFASSDLGSVVTRAMLTVLDRPGPPTQPVVRNQVGTAVHLEWGPPAQSRCGQIQGYTVEFREAGCEMWQLAIPYVPNTSQVIGDLEPGVTYQFRVSANNAVGISEPSIPSVYVAIPTEHELSEHEESTGAIWKATYDNDFTDGGEIGRGRFAVVRKCTQKCSGQELAAKIISRKLVRKEAVETEFNTLQSLQHAHLIQVYDLYESSANLIIITHLCPRGRLFEYICGKHHFDEVQAAEFLKQLLDVIQYLHNCRIAHLDIKPENLLVEIGAVSTNLKLIDFGDARHIYNNYYIHPMVGNPEFLAPEIVSGLPCGLLTDIWSVGVILYVLLSGVSPFLDESQEETCSNIVRNDFCFPDEYFAGISVEAKDLIRLMLVEELSKRPTAQLCEESVWIRKASIPRNSPLKPKPIATARLVDFIERRKHQCDVITMK